MSKHIIKMQVTVYMEDMTCHPELSAEIADEQVSLALEGDESVYGYPGTFTVQVIDFEEVDESPEDDTCHGYDTTRDYELDNPPEPWDGD
jgi:hypothetical protein